MKKILNKKGVTLVEIVISISILTIISVSFLQIFSGSFSKVINYGRSTANSYKASGELKSVLREIDQKFLDKNKVNDKTVDVLGKDVDIKHIESLTENKKGSLDIYVVEDSKDKSAFIDKNRNYILDSNETIINSTDLSGSYTYNGEGILVIPHLEALDVDENGFVDNIDWSVNNGIYVDDGILMKSKDKIKLMSNNGEIFINSTMVNNSIFEAKNEIIIKAKKINMRQSSISSNSNNIEFIANNIYAGGSDVRGTYVSVNKPRDILFKVDNTIYMNQYTYFDRNGTDNENYAINSDNADIQVENSDLGNKKFR